MIPIIRREILKEKPAAGTPLGFGRYFTDYVFTMKYTKEKGWHDAKIEPNEPKPFDLAMSIFHYGQGVFEGMKAFRQPDGSIAVFRPEENWARMNRSAERLCMPTFSEEVAQEGLEALIKLEEGWLPSEAGTSMYVRPVMVATRTELGVHASTEYLFYMLLSPTGSYFEGGLSPIKLIVEEFFSRAAPGGTGDAKCLGNYGSSLKAGELAEQKGFDQVLWLDAAEKKFVEEGGSMNIFFVMNGEVVTPALTGSILPGITRKSCLAVLRDRGYKVRERNIPIEEVAKAAEQGALEEAFGTGTAAVISPVGLIHYRGKDHLVGNGKMGKVTRMLYDTVTGIQSGRLPDTYGWRKIVK